MFQGPLKCIPFARLTSFFRVQIDFSLYLKFLKKGLILPPSTLRSVRLEGLIVTTDFPHFVVFLTIKHLPPPSISK